MTQNILHQPLILCLLCPKRYLRINTSHNISAYQRNIVILSTSLLFFPFLLSTENRIYLPLLHNINNTKSLLHNINNTKSLLKPCRERGGGVDNNRTISVSNNISLLCEIIQLCIAPLDMILHTSKLLCLWLMTVMR